MTEARLHIVGYPDSDDEERAELAWRLEEDVRAADVEAVARPAAVAPLAAVVGWNQRHPGAAVTVELRGDKLTLDRATEEERSRLVQAFLDRHADA